MNLARHALRAVARAEECASKLPEEILALDGMSSPRVRHLLNNLCSFDGCRYLEIGSFKGASILSASYRNPGSFIGVDNFSEFGGPAALFDANRARWQKDCSFRFLEANAWDLKAGILAPVNVYYYDGSHSYADQYRAFTHFDACFEREFIAVIDDWNVPEVRQATISAFVALEYRTKSRWDLRSRGNGDVDGWWNGVLVAVVEKPHLAAPGLNPRL